MKISIEHIISEVQEELGLIDDNETPIFRTWAYEAQREIGTSEINFKDSDWLPLIDGVVQKPCDLLAPLKIEISIDKNSCIIPYIAPDFVKCDCCENCRSTCDIVGGETPTTFFFSSDASQYVYARILYVSIPVDDCGDPLIDERAARAVKQYIAYMYLKRKRRMYVGDNAQIPQSEISVEYDLWRVLRKEAMGRMKMPNPTDMKWLGRAWVTSGVTPAMFSRRWGLYGNYANVIVRTSELPTHSKADEWAFAPIM